MIASAIGIWAAVIVSALFSNPSLNQTQLKLSEMNNDLSYLLAQGGKVVSSTKLAKYGRAHSSRVIAVEGWSSALLARYVQTLQERKWKQLPGPDLEFCKDGMLAVLKENAGMLNRQSVNYLDMAFDAATIKKCSNAGVN
jgi:hypothetical protein